VAYDWTGGVYESDCTGGAYCTGGGAMKDPSGCAIGAANCCICGIGMLIGICCMGICIGGIWGGICGIDICGIDICGIDICGIDIWGAIWGIGAAIWGIWGIWGIDIWGMPIPMPSC
jgi:hypothetical protein